IFFRFFKIFRKSCLGVRRPASTGGASREGLDTRGGISGANSVAGMQIHILVCWQARAAAYGSASQRARHSVVVMDLGQTTVGANQPQPAQPYDPDRGAQERPRGAPKPPQKLGLGASGIGRMAAEPEIVVAGDQQPLVRALPAEHPCKSRQVVTQPDLR